MNNTGTAPEVIQTRNHLCPVCKNTAISTPTQERQRLPVNTESCCFKREVKTKLKCTGPKCDHTWHLWLPLIEDEHEHSLELISFNGSVIVQRCGNIIHGHQCPRTTVINLKRPIFL